MSNLIYFAMKEKPIFWVHTTIKTPPFSGDARIEAGILLRKLQYGESIPMPFSKPMPSIGVGCHELRINDCENGLQWRIIYHLADDAIVVLYSFPKKTGKTPQQVIDTCKGRIREYYRILNGE